MKTINLGTIGRAAPKLEPLVVSPRQACLLLNCGITRLYELFAAGELTSYHDGRVRRITMESVRARVARLAATAGAEEGGVRIMHSAKATARQSTITEQNGVIAVAYTALQECLELASRNGPADVVEALNKIERIAKVSTGYIEEYRQKREPT